MAKRKRKENAGAYLTWTTYVPNEAIEQGLPADVIEGVKAGDPEAQQAYEARAQRLGEGLLRQGAADCEVQVER